MRRNELVDHEPSRFARHKNLFKGIPILGDVGNIIDRPGDIIHKPFQTLAPLAGDALMLGGIPGVGGPLASFTQGVGGALGKFGMMTS